MAINHYTPSNAISSQSMNPISLRDVIDLRVAIHWTEAVAVVEALCHRLIEDYPGVMSVPELADIMITSRGSVMIRRGASSDQGLEGLAHTLHELLGSAQTPMPLRLFVTHSTGAGRPGSVNEFVDALDYYAPSDRDGLVVGLYARCLEAPVPALDAAVPGATDQSAESKPVKRNIPRWLPFAAAVLVMLVSGVAVLTLGDSDPTLQASVATVRGAVASAVAAVRESFNPNPPVAEASVEPVEPVQEPSRRPRNRQAALPSGSTLSRTLVTRYPASPAPAGTDAVDDSAPGDEATPTSGTIIEPPIYSAGSPGVLPPVMRAPKLPPVAPAHASDRDTNTIELLIDESGQVTQARLLTRPMRMPDMMLLSGAKAFKFYPAVKDGKPVKYRLALDWVHSTP